MIIIVVSFLEARDLVMLERINRRFGSKQAHEDQHVSLVAHAARCIFFDNATVNERNALPRYSNESDILMLCHLDSLREQLRFPQLIGANISYSLAGAKSSVTMNGTNWCSATSSYVMRAGKHTATFIISSEDSEDTADETTNMRSEVFVGITRQVSKLETLALQRYNPVFIGSSQKPFGICGQELLNERTDNWGLSQIHCYAYNCDNGNCMWSDWEKRSFRGDAGWDGAGELLRVDGAIGLVLDLNLGNLTVVKNGVQLGVMKSGLSGEYSWFVSCRTPIFGSSCTVTIEKGTLEKTLPGDIVVGNFGACCAQDERHNYYIFKVTEGAREIKEDAELDCCGGPKMRVCKGDLICQGIWMDNLLGAGGKHWWTMSDEPCIVRLQDIVHPNLSLEAMSTTNPLPKRLLKTSVQQAKTSGAWKVIDKVHASIMAKVNIREGYSE